VRRIVAEDQLDQPAVGPLTDGCAQRLRRRLGPQRLGQQCGERHRRRPGGDPLGQRLAYPGDQGRARRGVRPDDQVSGQGGPHPAVTDQVYRLHRGMVRQLDAPADQVHAGCHPGARDPFQLSALPVGDVVGSVGEQHGDPPRLGPAAGRRRQAGQAPVTAAEHVLVDPADLFGQVVEERAEATGPAVGHQLGRGQRGESGQRAAELARVVHGDSQGAGRHAGQGTQQQATDDAVGGAMILAQQVEVRAVQQRHQRG
jgi:hypothetical protein